MPRRTYWQKIQLKLALARETGSEAPADLRQGHNSSSAACDTEHPAALIGLTMEAIVARDNLKKALAKVRQNKGAPGIDGTRALGIPTVLDRFIQQAMLQVLQKAFDPTFSSSSYGFRPKRSAHQAVAAAQQIIADGFPIVVDLDLEKFFDRVNHDKLMGLMARRVDDRRILMLTRAYLTAGVLMNGLVQPIAEGTPQGGPLSPLLSNLMLDVLDKELERRGHRFVRYAGDCNIYVRTARAGERVMISITRYLEKKLKLKVNKSKSAVAAPNTRKFLGFSFWNLRQPKRRIAPQALSKFRSRVRQLTRRTQGRSLRQIVKELSRYLVGWRGYFGFCETPTVLRDLDSWTRRRLRAIIWKQWKNGKNRYAQLKRLGIDLVTAAMSAAFFQGLGLASVTRRSTRAE